MGLQRVRAMIEQLSTALPNERKMLSDCIADACKFTSKIHVQTHLPMEEKVGKPGTENGGV